ncbi:MAG: DnaJ family domain-containing protein [Burkholderiales bacterium]
MLKALDDLIETRIRDAQSRGEFDHLPGTGRPLPDEDFAGVPEELRVAVRILKNAGCVPAEVEALRDLDAMVMQLARGSDGDERPRDPEARKRGERRLLALTMALESRGLGRTAAALIEYRDRIVDRLAR